MLAWLQTFHYLRAKVGQATRLNGTSPRIPVLDHEDRPAIRLTEQCTHRHMHDITDRPENEAGLDSVAIAKLGPRRQRLVQVQDYSDALLFYTKGRDFGEAGRFNSTHMSMQQLRTTPTINLYTHAGAQTHGIGGQHVHRDFQTGEITKA